jgi:hypothetical protein
VIIVVVVVVVVVVILVVILAVFLFVKVKASAVLALPRICLLFALCFFFLLESPLFFVVLSRIDSLLVNA